MYHLKIKIDDKIIDTPAVWLADEKNGIIKMIDQRNLPWKFAMFESHSVRETAWAIKNFVVRGAPTIGATAAYGAYQAVLEASNKTNFWKNFIRLMELLEASRPTAYNLFHATNAVKNFVSKLLNDDFSINKIRESTLNFVKDYVNNIIRQNYKIGEYGEKIIRDGARILTHCNAGALAAVDYGTATAPIYLAHQKGKKILVYIDETRPWLQGARLTAWELSQAGIPHYIISDNAAGYLMWRGEIDLVIVGADRITLNGDVANKIGTYKLALAAKDNGIPFYVAAPTSTIDPHVDNGALIPIEERDEDEIHYVRGEYDGKIVSIRITPTNSRAKNPVFDVTPARLIDGIITEFGIIAPTKIRNLLNRSKPLTTE